MSNPEIMYLIKHGKENWIDISENVLDPDNLDKSAMSIDED